MQNHVYIRQLVQELMKYFQASVEHICCLLFFNQGSMSAVYHKYAILFLRTPKFSKAYALMYTFSHCISVFVNRLPLVSCFFTSDHIILFYGMFFTIEVEKSFTLPCIILGVTVILLRGGAGLCQYIRCSFLRQS